MKTGLFMGIDLGSTSTEAVVLDDNHRIVTQLVMDTEPNHKTCIDKLLGLVNQQLSGLSHPQVGNEDIRFCVGTGYGRENIHCAGKTISEIGCHARGAQYYFPAVHTIIDIGGQDSKVISIDEKGEVKDFVMNEKCAAGTGRFLEAISEVCEISLEELGATSMQAEFETTISSMCTVFAESEVISKLAEGAEKESIIRGLHAAIAFRVLSMGKRVGIKAPLVFSGGVARNIGMVQVLREKTGFDPHQLIVPPQPQAIGALGAALFAAQEWENRQNTSPSIMVTAVDAQTPAQEKVNAVLHQLTGEPSGGTLVESSGNETGYKAVVGWTDLAVPLEILAASNIRHIRITGDLDKGTSSDRYIRTYSCSYIKNAVSALLEESEKYKTLDGIITTNCCSATEKMADVLHYQHHPDNNENNHIFVYPLTVPRKFSPEAVDYMKKQILSLKTFIEETCQTTIEEEKLRTVGHRYNEARILIREYNTLLAAANFPNPAAIIGRQMEQFWQSGQVTTGILADLRRKIQLVKGLDPLPNQGPRILLAGGIIPDIKFYHIFDNIKCHMVYNHTSSGNKFSETLLDLEEPDIYLALARRCLSPYTPRAMDPALRMAKIKELVDRYNVKGIIFNLTKFCVYYTFEAVLLKEYCEHWRIPLLVLETDFTGKSLGQLKTRVEAFIETFAGKET
jgi:predicted CoA-substrate-specific enzyme activase